MYKNSLISRTRLISRFMTSLPGQQTVAIHILLNISRNKSNEIIEFGQLIEYYMRNTFVEKSYVELIDFCFCSF